MKTRNLMVVSTINLLLLSSFPCHTACAGGKLVIFSEYDTTFGETDTSLSSPHANAETAMRTASSNAQDSSFSPIKLSSFETITAQDDGPLSEPLNNPNHLRRTNPTRQAVPIHPEAYKARFNLPLTTTAGLAPVFGMGQESSFYGLGLGTLRDLPPTRLDSFVKEAQGRKELIYGDESTWGWPPYFGFSEAHRINAGIIGGRSTGLTTGHGSLMPSAVGRDEFLGGEWSMSGP